MFISAGALLYVVSLDVQTSCRKAFHTPRTVEDNMKPHAHRSTCESENRFIHLELSTDCLMSSSICAVWEPTYIAAILGCSSIQGCNA
eukprot:5181457-Amphidinium_carterae.1